MDQKLMLLGGLVVLIIVILLLAQPGPQAPVPGEQFPVSGLQPPGGEPVVLQTENARLEIPPEALPPGFDPSQITMEEIGSDELPIQWDDGGTGYSLGPSGLQFTVPVNLTLELQTADGIPLIFQASEEGIELVDGVEYTVNGEQVTANVPLSHFSEVFYAHAAAFKIWAVAPDTYEGEVVEAEANVEVLKSEFNGKAPGYGRVAYEIIPGSTIIHGRITTGSMEPYAVENRPPKTQLGESFVIPSRDWTCKYENDNAYLRFHIFFDWKERPVGFAGNITKDRWFAAHMEVNFSCLEKEDVCGDGRLSGNEECDLADNPQYNQWEGAKAYTCKKGQVCDKDCKCIEPELGPASGIVVTEKECMFFREGAYLAGLLYYCKWYFENADGSSLACMDLDGEYPTDMIMEMTNGDRSKGHMEIAEETEDGEILYTRRILETICPDGSQNCDCSKMRTFIRHGNYLVLEKMGDMVTMYISRVNPKFFTYSGDGDSITLIHPGLDKADSEWFPV